ncbi:RipA family octameric membrane protein [Peribacillus sp. TH27]|uniref:RipA family octameric membrane protein n=1 Tax=Peribacillus sp. TH27 TaxID=2798484 RepID=UPI001914227C|nr:hypothetical protein [Peribacillus sp. TH27]MBK5458950.1 hypothetical protein [Peribacillus sp. TH27]
MAKAYRKLIKNTSAYDRTFKVDREKALEYALDIRKFEIDLYWKRATYFWTFIGVAFAGYFALLAAKNIPEEAIFLVNCLGFIFTFSWYLVNRGSKFWQNNWERHVDMLEDKVIGPLYKTAINMKHPKMIHIFDEYPFSVSKINQILSLFLCIVWIFLGCRSISSLFNIFEPFKGFNMLLIGLITLIYIVIVLIYGKSTPNLGDNTEAGKVFVVRKSFLE